MGDRERIRKFLADERLSYSWLLFQLHLSGIETDKTELSSVLYNKRAGNKAESIVLKAIEILDDYERYFVNRFVGK